jgi:hypothetical protein
MIGYEHILRASEEARGLDFKVKKKVVRKLFSNPLCPFFSSLSDFLITHSAEAIDMMRSKSGSASPKKKAKISNEQVDNTVLERALNLIPQSPVIDQTPFPQLTPVGNKRVFSGESYGHSSTETTPTKIKHSEPLTQALQNTLIGTLFQYVWLGGAEIAWARNREMYLDYRPYFLSRLEVIVDPSPHHFGVG